jgi:hypothetical protein
MFSQGQSDDRWVYKVARRNSKRADYLQGFPAPPVRPGNGSRRRGPITGEILAAAFELSEPADAAEIGGGVRVAIGKA